jgi:hypothetical protein
MNRERLLNVARALRESPNPDAFTMDYYIAPCGTPACAFGHYVSRPDLQTDFLVDGIGIRDANTGRPIGHTSQVVRSHFGISLKQTVELFDDSTDQGAGGCGGAKTPLEAAEYIEDFVRRHSAEETAS